MKWVRRRWTYGGTAWKPLLVLLVLSAGALLLPISVTGRANSLVQVLAPFQGAVDWAVDGVGSIFGAAAADRPSDLRVQALRSVMATLAAQNRALRGENEVLTRVRGRGLGTQGRLIPARMVADDSIHWRESKMLLAGLRRGVAAGDGVVTDHFSVEVSEADGAATGMAVLSAETLVGTISQVGRYTSRVQLLSDPETRMPVTIGRVDGTVFTGVGAAFWLVGKGHGGIEIRDVHHRYIADRAIRVGDMVVTQADDAVLPPSVTIGTITGLGPDPHNSLLYTLQVDPGVDVGELRRVFVVDTSR